MCSPQAKGGHRGKGPVKKQSREEKTQGGKEQEEEERHCRSVDGGPVSINHAQFPESKPSF
jgi:hypothetical protein